jgi:hypothetical protein
MRVLIMLLLPSSVLAARPVAPLAFARLASRQPIFRCDGAATVEICRDAACAEVLAKLDAPSGTATPPQPLPAGRLFWRAVDASGTSPSWPIIVPVTSAPVAAGIRGYRAPADSVGDLDGDGLPEHAWRSKKAGLSVTLSRSKSASVLPSPAKTRTFGEQVTFVGDTNGDGYGDLLVGAPGANQAYLYLGSPTGPATIPSVTFEWTSKSETARFGASAGALGDINGDGLADFYITAPSSNRIFVFTGRAPLPSATPAKQWFGGGDTQFPSAVVAPGDVDGDGFADLLYSALDGNNRTARLLRGSVEGLRDPTPLDGAPSAIAYEDLDMRALGDVDGDGRDDLLISAPVESGPRRWTLIRGMRITQQLRGETLIVSGDIDGDGFDDFVLDGETWFGARAGPTRRAKQ